MPDRKRVWVDARQLEHLKAVIRVNRPARFGDNVVADLETDTGAIAAAIRAAIMSFRKDHAIDMQQALYADMAQNIRNVGQLLMDTLAANGLIPSGLEIFLKEGVVWVKIPDKESSSESLERPLMMLPRLDINRGELSHEVREIRGQVM